MSKGPIFQNHAFTSTIRAEGSSQVSAADLALINKLAHRELRPEEVFVFPGVVSNGQVDSYFTAMAPSSTRNYVQDLAAGVALMVSHRTGGWTGGPDLPLGRSFFGELRGDEVRGRFYLIRGFTPNPGQVGTDEVIRGIEAGVINALSIGFKMGGDSWFRCSICGLDMMRDPACVHYPGRKYGTADGQALAFAWVENAHLAECSLVYSAATPGAAITHRSAQRRTSSNQPKMTIREQVALQAWHEYHELVQRRAPYRGLYI